MDLWKLLIYFLTLRWLFGSSAAPSPTTFGGEAVCDDRNHNGICDDEEKNSHASGSSHYDDITALSPVLPAYDLIPSADATVTSAYQTDPLATTQPQPDISLPYPLTDPVNVHIHDDVTPEEELPEYWFNDDDDLEEVDPFEEYENHDEEEYDDTEEAAEEDEDAHDSFGFLDSDEDDSSWSDSFDDEDS